MLFEQLKLTVARNQVGHLSSAIGSYSESFPHILQSGVLPSVTIRHLHVDHTSPKEAFNII